MDLSFEARLTLFDFLRSEFKGASINVRVNEGDEDDLWKPAASGAFKELMDERLIVPTKRFGAGYYAGTYRWVWEITEIGKVVAVMLGARTK